MLCSSLHGTALRLSCYQDSLVQECHILERLLHPCMWDDACFAVLQHIYM